MILAEIAEKTRMRIAEKKRRIPLEQLRAEVEQLPKREGFLFEEALKKQGLSFICEVKKASPSKGIIAETFPYVEIAKDYEEAGASAISCLTEPYYFKGADSYLEEIAKTVQIPVLRKDFTVDPYMIYEAKQMGASAVLLICAILEESQLKEYLSLCGSLALSALVEAHTKEEVEQAVRAGARIIGVNNRDLKTFQVDITTSARLKKYVPQNCIYVSESGIKTPSDINMLRENGTDAVLIGETIMRASDKKEALRYLRGETDDRN